jgi:two-component system nitrogen regulation response regulator NtrX
MNATRILVVDDEPEICRLLREILEDEAYTVTTAENAAQAREAYRKHRPDLVLLDIWMPDTDGITLLKEWSSDAERHPPVVMMSGHGTVETAVEAIRLGAHDFVEKPLSMGKLLVTLRRALESERLRQENVRLRSRVEPAATLIGRSPPMQALREQLERIAVHDTWVLITGEPGSGKAVAARYVHGHSARKDKPLIELSLAAVPAQNVAIALFGTEQGEAVPGAFEQASGGTLLLDEIGDLDLATQSRLLSALAERRFLRVGGAHPIDLDVRVIAVTSQDLEKAVREGRFREDLYYRLAVVPIRVPPLREHRDDVPELVAFYLNWFLEQERLPYRRCTTAALNLLRNYAWPGNIRELKNLVQRLLILNREGDIDVAEVEQALTRQPTRQEEFPDTLFQQPLRAARDRFERAYLEYHLKRTGGNVTEVAGIAEMERTHLYRKLKGLGIDPKTGKED